MNGKEREAMIRELFPLVRRIAVRVNRLIPSADRDDLIGDGCVGAIKAVDYFDETRNVPLAHYAARVIAGAILNGVRSMDTVPERVRREIRVADRERYDIAAKTGTLPTQAEMEERRPKLRRAVALASRYTPLSLDDTLPLGERLTPDWGADPARVATDRAARGELSHALSALPERQRKVLVLHYVHGHPLSRIGRLMHISPQRASQLHIAGMKKLKAAMHAVH